MKKRSTHSFFRVIFLTFSLFIAVIFLFSCGESQKVAELEAKVAELQKKNTDLEKGAASVGKTLGDVRAKGFIQVGVNEGLFGFAKPDEKGVWRGLDVDTARAISVAVFGEPDKLKFTPLTAKTRFTALQSGEIDVLTRNCTQTLGRETALGLNFVHVNYYDGQGFLVPKKLGIKSALELDGATVCVLPGTTTELNVADYFRTNNMKMNPVVIESTPELAKTFFAGRCDVLTSDASQLAGTRAVAPNPSDYVVLPEIISREPLAPAVRHGDDQWYDIINFSVMAMIEAEYLGITSQNIDAMMKSKDPKVQRFLGVSAGNGKALGLDEMWAYNIVKKVGNYGEVFERNIGVNTPLAIARGLNALWTNGGLMYTPPFK
ncbi:MAG: amino acid ABC transporter substrate-binding protein [Deltaproteobacteria bacterium]|nr:amino acid ABC transporter substrate-binding protein [Deltaproteobacteria bacterium]